jgi:hypothetical protein
VAKNKNSRRCQFPQLEDISPAYFSNFGSPVLVLPNLSLGIADECTLSSIRPLAIGWQKLAE